MAPVQMSAPSGAAAAPIRAASAGAQVLRTVAKKLSLDRHLEFWGREVDPAYSLTELRAKVTAVVTETHDVKTFVLAPNALWRGHRAGQFVEVGVEIGGVLTKRCYSLSSAPGSAPSITVKRVGDGRVSTFLHAQVKVGHVLRLGAPTGTFVLPEELPEKLLLLSGGSGVTPVMSILRDLAARGAVNDVVFVHAARTARDVLFADELWGLAARHPGLRVFFVLEDDARAGGRVTADKLRAMVPDLDARETMLCGPAAMMDSLARAFDEGGIGHRLRTERFSLAPIPRVRRDGPEEKVTVSLLRAHRTVEAAGSTTLLEELEAAGERPESGCRMGICNTCRCMKRSGVVENVLTGELSGGPDEEIRLCVSRARTDLELDLG